MSNSEFIIIGCGYSGSVTQYNNNALFRTPEGSMLIDCGHTIKHALHAQGLSFHDVDAIFITHVHGDHVFGLERIAFETRFNSSAKPKLFLKQELIIELWDQTLKGSLGAINGELQTLEDYFDVQIIEGDSFRYGGHHFNVVPVPHTPLKPSYALVIDEYLFYSGDTCAIPDIISTLNFSIGFHDAYLHIQSPVHAQVDELLELYPKHIRDKLFLMSYEDDWELHERRIEMSFKGLAKQGQSIPIDTESSRK